MTVKSKFILLIFILILKCQSISVVEGRSSSTLLDSNTPCIEDLSSYISEKTSEDIVAATVTRRQYKLAEASTGASATFDSSPLQGSLLVVIGGHRKDIGDNTISGSGWTQHIYHNVFTGQSNDRRGLAVWTKIAGASEPSTITIDFGSSGSKVIIQEFAITGGSFTGIDKFASNQGTTSSTTSQNTGTTSTTSNTNTLVVSALVGRYSAVSTPVFDGGLQNTVGSNDDVSDYPSMFSAFAHKTSTGTQSSTATWSTAIKTTSAIIAYGINVSGSGGGGGNCNVVNNPEFDSSTSNWSIWNNSPAASTLSIDNTGQLSGTNSAKVNITNGGTDYWHSQLYQTGHSVSSSKTYNLTFEAKAGASKSIRFRIQDSASPWTTYYSSTINISTSANTYTINGLSVSATDPSVNLIFEVGNNTTPIWIDNIVFEEVGCEPTGFTCDDGVTLDIYGEGTTTSNNITITVPTLSNVNETTIEVAYKGCYPGSSITVGSSIGNLVLNEEAYNGNSYSAYVYRRTVTGGVTNITEAGVCGSGTSGSGLQSMTVYVERDLNSNVGYSSVFTTIGGYNNLQTFSLPIPTSTSTRDLTLKLPISEVTSDDRFITVNASSNTGSVTGSVTITGPDLSIGDCCFAMPEITLYNVPANSTAINFEIDTRAASNPGPPAAGGAGQSYAVSGTIYTSYECECENLTSGGTIGSDESNCGSYNPAIITNVTLPSGGLGSFIEYQWQQRNQPCGGSYGSWTTISGANSSTYNPPTIGLTTQYRRRAKRDACGPYINSNTITKEVSENYSSGGVISGNETNCGGYNPANITSTEIPSGGCGGNPIYLWQKRTKTCGSSWSAFSNISGAVSATYNPPAITVTTQYRRLARRTGCSASWSYSNSITKVVVENYSNGGTITGDESQCSSYNPAEITNLTEASGGCGGQFLTNPYPAFPIDFQNNNCSWIDYDFSSEMLFVDNGNGTVTISGTILDGIDADWDACNSVPCGSDDHWNLEITLSDKQDHATFIGNGGVPYVNSSCSSAVNDLEYWDLTGTLTGLGCNTGRTINLNGPKAPHRLQIGFGGNSNDSGCSYGLSTWFNSTEGAAMVGSDIYGFLDAPSIIWQKRELNCATETYGSWSTISGATGLSYDPPSVITSTTQYRRLSRRATGCSSSWAYSDIVTKEVIQAFTNAGTIGNNESFCGGYDPANIVSLTSPSGGCGGTITYLWQTRSLPCGGSWSSFSNIPNSNSPTYNPGPITTTTRYRRLSRRAGCSWIYSTEVVKEVIEQYTDAGTISGDQSLCGGYDPDNITGTTPTGGCGGTTVYLWQTRSLPCGGAYSAWSNVPSSNIATYNPGAITITTQYRRLTKRSNGCSPGWVYSNVVTKEVVQQTTDGGAITGDELMCGGYDPGVIGSTSPATGGCDGTIAYYWGVRTVYCDGTKSAYTNFWDGETHNPGPITETKEYIRRARRISGCSPSWSYSNTVIKEVVQQYTGAGTIAGNETMCGSYNPAIITSTQDPVGGCRGTETHVWQKAEFNCSTNSYGGYTNISGASNTTYDPPTITVTTKYRRVSYRNNTCTPPWVITNEVVKTVVDQYTDAGTIAGDESKCDSYNPALITSTTGPTGGCGGTNYSVWQKREYNCATDTYSSWSTVSGITTLTYDPPTVITVTTQYRRLSRRYSGCSPGWAYSAPVTKEVVIGTVSGGTIAASETVCAASYDPALITSTAAPTGGCGGTLEYRWYKWERACASSSWGSGIIISGATGLTYDPPVITMDTRYRRYARRASDCAATNGSWMVTNMVYKYLNTDIADAGTITGDQEACGSFTPALLTGTVPSGGCGNQVVTYMWQYRFGYGGAWIDIANSNSPNYQPITSTVTGQYRRKVVTGGCGDQFSNIVTLTINELPTATLDNSSFCPSESTVLEPEVCESYPDIKAQRLLETSGWYNQFNSGGSGLTGDGSLCFDLADASGQTSYQMIGLTTDPFASTHHSTIDYAMYILPATDNYRINIYENGANKGNRYTSTTSFIGSTFCVRRTGTTIEYLLDGTVVYTSLIASNGTLFYDNAFHSTSTGQYAEFENIQLCADASDIDMTYAWSGGGSGATKTVSATGTYTVTVTDDNGCQTTASATVSQEAPPNATLNKNRDLSCSYKHSYLYTNVNYPDFPWTFTEEMSYVSSGASCGSNYVNIIGQSPYSTMTQTEATITANSAYTFSLKYKKSGAGAAYARIVWYQSDWTYISVSQVTLTNTGSWTNATVTANAPANAGKASVQILVYDNATVDVDCISFTNAGGPELLADPSFESENPFQWSGPNGSMDGQRAIYVVNPGTYHVTVTDPNTGCTATSSITVNQDITPPNAAATNDGPLTCAKTSVTLTASSTTTGATYNWSNGLGTNATALVSAPGTYTVTVTDPSNGCTATASTTVIQNNTPTPIFCERYRVYQNAAWSAWTNFNGNCDIEFCLEAGSNHIQFDGGPNINTGWVWKDEDGNTDSEVDEIVQFSGLNINDSGTYTGELTDANGCVSNISFNVIINPKPVVGVTGNGPLTCALTTVTLTATPAGMNYSWSGGGSSQSKNVTTPGTYTVTVTDANGCFDTASITVAQNNASPTVTASPNQTICNNGNTSISASSTGGSGSGYTYAWNNGLGSGASKSVTVNTLTNFIVTVTDSNGCTDTDQVTISVVSTPQASINVLDPNICSGETATITSSISGGTGTVSYQWQYSARGFKWKNISGATSSSFTTPALLATSYYRLVATFTGAGCQDAISASSIVDVEIPSIVVSATSEPEEICLGSTAVLTANLPAENGGLIDYSTWAVGTGSIPGFSANGLASENHRIVDTDPWGNSTVVWEGRPSGDGNGDGGFSTAAQTIDHLKTYRMSVWVNRTALGTDGRFYLGMYGYSGATNGVKYVSNSADVSNSYFWYSAAPPTNLPEDEWVLVVGHVRPSNHSGTSLHTDSGIYTTNDGKIINTQHDFKWLTTSTTALLRTYLFYGPSASSEQQWVYPRIDLIDGTEPSIDDMLNGYDANNGLGDGASFEWFTGSCGGTSIGTGESITVSPTTTTTYYVNATGNCNTSDCKNVTVTVNNPPVASAINDGPLTCDKTSVTLTATPAGMTYAWSGGGTGQTKVITAPGTYTVTVTDSNGCSDTASTTVSENTTPTNVFCQQYRVLPHGGSWGPWTSFGANCEIELCELDGLTDIQVDGGPNINTGWVWEDEDNNVDSEVDEQVIFTNIDASDAGTYTATLTNSNGCISSFTFDVIVVATATAATSGNQLVCVGETATLTSSTTGGLGTPSYQWQISANNATWSNISGATSSTYTTAALNAKTYYRLIVSWDGLGCDSVTSAAATVDVDTESIALTSDAFPPSICPGGSTTLTVNDTIDNGGILDYSSWTVGTGGISGQYNASGANAENHRLMDNDPWGNSTVVWEAQPQVGNGSDGGWNSVQHAIDHTKSYRFSVWVNREIVGTSGRMYFGTNGYGSTNGLKSVTTGTSATNNYFYYTASPPLSSELPENEWVLMVGHIYPSNHTGTTNHPESGRYTMNGGKIGGLNTDYQWLPQTVNTLHRTFLYNCDDVSVRQKWVYPRLELLDGTEPSINEMLGGFDVNGGLGEGANWEWYTGSCGGTSVGTGKSITVSPNATTAYYVRGEGGSCNDSDCVSVTVTVNTPPTASATNDGNITCDDANSTMTALPAGMSYAWSGGGTGQTKTVTVAGTYTVTVTDANGCTDTAQTTVGESTTPTNIYCERYRIYENAVWGSWTNFSGNCEIEFCETPTATHIQFDGGPNINTGWVWKDEDGNIDSEVDEIVQFSGLDVDDSGTYTGELTDANGCISNISFTVIVNPNPDAGATSNGPLTCALTTVTLTATPAGMTYSWSGGGTGQTKSVTTPGTYTVTVTDSNGCTDTAQTIVTEDDTEPTADAGPDVEICLGENTDLTATGGGTYLWNTNATTPTINVAPTATTTYTVTVTSANGCTDSDQVIVTVVNNFTSPGTIGSDETFCSAFDPAEITNITLPTGGNDGTTYYYWQKREYDCSTESYGAWIGIGVNAPSYDPPAITVTTQYRRLARRTAGCSPSWVYSAVVTKEVVENFTSGGTIEGDESFCGGYDPTLITSFEDASGGCGGSVEYAWAAEEYDCATDAWVTTGTIQGATSSTYDPPAITVSTRYLRLARRWTGCAGGVFGYSISGYVVKEVVTNFSDSGTVSGDESFCGPYDPALITSTVDPFGGCGGTPYYIWQERVFDCNTEVYGSWSTITGENGLTYNPGPITVTTQYRRNARRSSSCTPLWSFGSPVTKEVVEQYSGAGTIAGGDTQCGSYNPALITSTVDPIGGCSGTEETRWYKWERNCSTGSWGSGIYIPGATSHSYDPPAITVSTRYRRYSRRSDDCNSTVGSWLVSNIIYYYVEEGPNSGGTIASDQDHCGSFDPVILTGDVATGCSAESIQYQWQYRLGTIGTFIDIANTDNEDYDPPVATETIQYRRKVRTGICGDSFSNVVTITVYPLLDASATNDGPITCADPTVTLTALPAGMIYAWSGGGTGQTKNVTAPGVYTVTVTDGNGCSDIASTTVTESITPPNAGASNDGPLTCANTSVILTATSTTPGATYAWSGGGSNATKTVSEPGTYTVTVTDPINGCTTTAQTIVIQNNTPTPIFCQRYRFNHGGTWGSWINFSGNCDIELCEDNGLTDIQFDGGPDINTGWEWKDEDGNIDPEVDEMVVFDNIGLDDAGTYTGELTNSDGCISNISFNVIVNPNPIAGATSNGPLTCALTTATMTATPAGMVYAWSGGGTAQTKTTTLPGTYTVTVTDPNGCSDIASVIVTQDDTEPTVTVNSPDICIGESVSLTATGGGTYAWPGSLSGASITVSPNTTTDYIVTVTSTNGCTATATATVTVNPLPNSGIVKYREILCAPAPGYIYATVSYPNAINTLDNASLITGSAGCGNKHVRMIGTSPNAYFTENLDNAVTAGNTYNLNFKYKSTGPGLFRAAIYYYDASWGYLSGSVLSFPTTGVWTDGTVPLLSPANAVNVQVRFLIGDNNTADIDCIEFRQQGAGSAIYSESFEGSMPYQWSGPNGFTGIGRGLYITEPGTYSLTVTDPNTGCTAVNSTVVNEYTDPPNAGASNDGPLTCANTSVDLTATSTTVGATFLWSNNATTAVTSVTTPGTYTVTVTDPSNGCTTTAQTIVIQNNTPTPIYCQRYRFGYDGVWENWINFDGNCDIELCVGDGLTDFQFDGGPDVNTGWVWTDEDNIADSETDEVVLFSNIGLDDAGTYTGVLTNSDGCVSTLTFNVIVNPNPVASASNDGPLTCAKTNVTLTALPAGMTYIWSGGGTAQTKSVSAPGMYDVTVTDANGCSSTATTTVIQNIATPNVSASNDGPLTCANLSVDLTATSTTPGATFLWSNNATTAVTSVTTPGTYTVTVTDPNNGCTETAQTIVIQNNTPTPIYCERYRLNYGSGWESWIAFNGNCDIEICEGDGLTDFQFDGGPNINTGWVWTDEDNIVDGETDEEVNFYEIGLDDAGTYTGVLTNSDGCVSTLTFNVIVNPNPVASASNDGPLTCAKTNVTLTALPAGMTYIWSGGGTAQTKSVSTPGVYDVTVTDANGCSSTATTTVIQNIATPTPVASADQTICTGGNTNISASASGGSGSGYTYNWNQSLGAGASHSVTVNATTTYIVTVTDSNGCTDTDEVTISVVPVPQVSISVGNATICQGETATMTSNVSGGTGTPSYQWQQSANGNVWTNISGATTANYTTAALNATTQYQLLVSYSGAGCTTATSNTGVVTVETESIVISATADEEEICLGGSAVLTVNGPAANGGETDYSTWTLGTSSVGDFIRNGSDDENHRISGTDPWGNPTIVWEARPGAVSNSDGGWNHNAFPIDHTKPYRISTWVNRKVIGSNGRFFMGLNGYGSVNGVERISNGATITNSYFWVSNNPAPTTLPQDEWVLVVGHVYPSSHTGTTNHTDSGRYELDGTKIGSVSNDYQWLPQTTTARPRTYLYYTTDTNVRQQWVYPRFDLLDGTEPSVDDILNGFDVNNGLGTGASYEWFTGSCGGTLIGTGETITVNPTTTTTYYVRATGNCNTTACESVTVTVNNPPVAAATNDGTITCAHPNAQLTATPSGMSYTWSTNETTETISVNAPGTYDVTVTDSNGCTATASTTVTEDVTLPVADAGADQDICEGTSKTLTAIGGGTYQWSHSAGNTAIVSVMPAVTTTYTVTVTSANGCSDTDQVTITVNDNPTASVITTDAKCGQDNGTATATAGGGSGPYTYDWYLQSFQLDFQNVIGDKIPSLMSLDSAINVNGTVSAGYATLDNSEDLIELPNHVVDGLEDFEITIDFYMTDINSLNAIFSAANTSQNNALLIAYNNSTNFNIYMMGTNKSYSTSTLVINQWYTVKVRRIGTQVEVILDGVSLGVQTFNSTTINSEFACLGEEQDVVNGNYDPNQALEGRVDNLIIKRLYQDDNSSLTGLAPGLISVKITDSNGCAAYASAMVGEDTTLPDADAGSDQEICDGEDIILTASGGTNYLWSNGAGNTAVVTVSPSSTTTYTVTVTTNNGCTGTDDVTVEVNQAPLTPGVIDGDENACGSYDPAIITSTSDASGQVGLPISYNWQQRELDCNTNQWGAWSDIVGAHSVDYDSPVITTTTQYRRLAGQQGCSSSWLVSNVVIKEVIDNHTDPGTIVADQTGCDSFDPSEITGTAATGGCGSTAEYQWQVRVPGGTWANIAGATGLNYNPSTISETTEYQRLVRSLPCPYVASNVVVMTINKASFDAVALGSNLDCEGNCTGTIDVVVDHALTGDYMLEYTFEGNTTQVGPFTQDAATITNLCAGAYSNIQVISASTGCRDTWSGNVSITESHADWEHVTQTSDVSDCHASTCDGSFTIDANLGVTGAFTASYVFNGNTVQLGPFTSAGDILIDGLCAGNYSDITITSVESGCTDVWPTDIVIGTPDFDATILSEIDDDCQINEGSVTVRVTNGVYPYTIDWRNQDSTETGSTTLNQHGNVTIYGLTGGSVYCFKVTDSNGCIEN